MSRARHNSSSDDTRGFGHSTPVKAGDFEGVLVGADLRSLKLGGEEAIRRIGFAVRDPKWGTLAPALTQEHLEIGSREFRALFRTEFRQGAIKLNADVEIHGEKDGVISYRFDGEAEADFKYNRIGLIVLHPPSLAGCRVSIRRGGEEVVDSFPYLVEPQWIVANHKRGIWMPFDSMEAAINPEFSLHHAYEGDIFEIEDQRNWGDGSFKTYSTPLTVGWPRQARRGDRLTQRLTLTARGQTPAASSPSHQPTHLMLRETESRIRLPSIGFTVPPQIIEDQEALEWLRSVGCDHLLVRIEHELATQTQVAASLGCSIHIRGLPSQMAEAQVAEAQVDTLLVTGAGESPPDPTDLAMLRTLHPARGLLVATTGPFASLNSRRPLPLADGIAFPLSPQVHDHDTQTIVENLEAIPAMVETARRLGAGDGVAVGPITLHPTDSTDPRHASAMWRSWTVDALAALAMSGATSTTWCDVYGASGLVNRGGDGILRTPPMARVFKDLARFKTSQVLPVDKTRGPVAVLAVRAGRRLRVIVANLAGEDHILEMSLPETVEPLKITSVSLSDWVAVDQELDREAVSHPPSGADQLSLHLEPYGYASIDCLIADTG
ncbi:MAG: hypothetical protein ACRDWA_08415 [Acidimicrobiia bacterium]